MRNPFQPYPTTRGPVKLLIYGDPGTEKTRRALQMPGPIFMVDMEKGGDEYGNLVGPGGQYMTCASHTRLVEALDYLTSIDPSAVGTLVIDPITVVWASLQAGHAERQAQKKRCLPEEVIFDQGVWSRLNRVHGDIMTTLINAPYHVVMIARGKELKNDSGTVTGYGYEGHKSVEFLAKTVVQSRRDHDVIVKDRSGTWREGKAKRLDLGELVANSGTGGAKLPTPSEAAKQDASEGHHPSWEGDKGKFFIALRDAKLPKYDVVAAFCEATGRQRPSALDNQGRRDLYNDLTSDATRAQIAEFAKPADTTSATQDASA